MITVEVGNEAFKMQIPEEILKHLAIMRGEAFGNRELTLYRLDGAIFWEWITDNDKEAENQYNKICEAQKAINKGE